MHCLIIHWGAPFEESEQEIKGNDVAKRSNELENEASFANQQSLIFVPADTYPTFKCNEEPFKLSQSTKKAN